jgi:serine/threonine protein phosphatase PrpC
MGTRFGYYFLAHGFGSYDRSQFTPDAFVMKSITETLLDAPIENLARRYSQLSEKECEGAIRVAFEEASRALLDIASETALVTITGALIRGRSIVFGHVGTNRLLWLDRTSTQRLTRDHIIWPQMKLYSALGMLNIGTLTIDVSTYRDIGDGYLLLCTRKLWESVSEGSIRDAVMTSTNLENACTRLLTSARNPFDRKSMAMIIASNTN